MSHTPANESPGTDGSLISAGSGGWGTWTAAERESFFDAIARHRRAAWRVTLATRTINLVVALTLAVLMSPLFYGAFALLLDLINLVVPAPNAVPRIVQALDQVLNSPEQLSAAGWVRFAFFTALPGLLWMALVLNALRRVLAICMAFDSSDLAARPPDRTVLAEQRFANVVAEMAIAASLPPPRVFVADNAAPDAAAFGLDEQHSTLVVSQGLLNLLDRAQMEGVAANLIASIADGDMRIGLRTGLSLSLFALISRLGKAITEEHARRNIAAIIAPILLPTKASARKLVTQLIQPVGDASRAARARATTPAQVRWEKIRPYLWMPLAGPLVITGFFIDLVNLFVLSPLLSLAWRQRKYMADATAVRLTRDPDMLAGALERITTARGAPLAVWTAHMSIADYGGKKAGIFGGSVVPMFPSIERRLRALGTMGAHVPKRAPWKIPPVLLIVLVPLLSLLVLMLAIMFPLLICLSLMMTSLFTALPFALVHILLRWLGHH